MRIFWLLHQQADPHVVVNIQFAADEAEFDRKLGWFIGQQKLHEYVRGDLTKKIYKILYNYDRILPLHTYLSHQMKKKAHPKVNCRLQAFSS